MENYLDNLEESIAEIERIQKIMKFCADVFIENVFDEEQVDNFEKLGACLQEDYESHANNIKAILEHENIKRKRNN